MHENVLISRQQLEDILLRIFDTLGVSREDAKYVAVHLGEAGTGGPIHRRYPVRRLL